MHPSCPHFCSEKWHAVDARGSENGSLPGGPLLRVPGRVLGSLVRKAAVSTGDCSSAPAFLFCFFLARERTLGGWCAPRVLLLAGPRILVTSLIPSLERRSACVRVSLCRGVPQCMRVEVRTALVVMFFSTGPGVTWNSLVF